MSFGRVKNRLIARLFTRFPFMARWAAGKVPPMEFGVTPWTSFNKPLDKASIAIITTAGVHLKADTPFDMSDETGDPSFRVIPSQATQDELMITHDYYNHADADIDVNIVLPKDRVLELSREGKLGSVPARHYSFMGHLKENHYPRFLEESIPKVAQMLRQDKVDGVIITPG